MEGQPKPNIDSVLRERNLAGIERLTMAGVLPSADLQKAIVVNRQLEANANKSALPETSQIDLPNGQSIDSGITKKPSLFEPYYPGEGEISNIKGELRDLLTLVIQAQRNNTKFSPDIIQKMYPDFPYSKARSNFYNKIQQLKKGLTGCGLELVSIMNESRRKNGTWRIQKPNSPESITVFGNNPNPTSSKAPESLKGKGRF